MLGEVMSKEMMFYVVTPAYINQITEVPDSNDYRIVWESIYLCMRYLEYSKNICLLDCLAGGKKYSSIIRVNKYEI